MTLILDGVNLEDYVKPEGEDTEYIKVHGPNEDYTLNGTFYEQIIAVKLSAVYICEPLTKEQNTTLTRICIKEKVEATLYDELTGAEKTMLVRPTKSVATKVIEVSPTEKYYDGVTLTLEEV